MSEHVSRKLLKEFLEAFNQHNLDAIMDYFAEDLSLIHISEPTRPY